MDYIRFDSGENSSLKAPCRNVTLLSSGSEYYDGVQRLSPIFLFLSCLTFGQTPSTPTSRLDGVVTDALSGAPVRRATLTLTATRGNTGTIIASTDGDGKFSITGVAAGNYKLFLEKSGYLNQEYGSKNYQYAGDAITLGSGETKSDLQFKAMKQSVITGKVIDEDGDPVTQSSVSAMQKSRWNTRSGGTNGNTNDIGEFRIAGLIPGKYIVVANSFNRRMNRSTTGMINGVMRTIRPNVTQQPATQEEDFAPTFFPSANDEASASIIDILPGQQMDNIVIRMRKIAVYSIRGTAQYIGSKPPTEQGVQVQLIPKDAVALSKGFGARQISTMLQKDGAFEFQGVAPGSYNVAALRHDLAQWPLGSTPIDVHGNVENLGITFGDPAKLAMEVIWEDKEETKPVNGYVMLTSITVGNFVSPTLMVKEGKLPVTGVPGGTYSAQFQSTDAIAYVKQIRDKSGTDLGRQLTIVENTNPELTLVLSTKMARLEGSVSADGKAAGNTTVVLLPDGENRGSMGRLRTYKTDAGGRFKMERVVPGSYKLFAFEEEIPGNVFLNGAPPQFLENKGTVVTVKEESTEKVDLTVTKVE